jgi:predicted nuclease of predicted toxin-antitoxin system
MVRHGHEAVDVRDVELGSAADDQVAGYARVHAMCLVTADFGFADIRNYPPDQYAGLVVLELPRNATAETILGILDSLLRQADIMERLQERLAIVASGSVRLRPR